MVSSTPPSAEPVDPLAWDEGPLLLLPPGGVMETSPPESPMENLLLLPAVGRQKKEKLTLQLMHRASGREREDDTYISPSRSLSVHSQSS